MSEKVFPASKPATNGTHPATAAAPATATAVPNPTAAANKSHLYNPTSRHPYRPQPHNRRRRTRSGRSICCCCCFWTILIILLLLLLASIAGAAMYIFMKPHRPVFSIPSLRIHRMNLTTSADSATSHVSTLLNFTLIAKNPNSHLSLFYDPFTITSSSSDVFLGNGTLPGFALSTKNETSMRNVIVSGSNEVDAESVSGLRSDLRKKSGVASLKIQLDTKVVVKVGKFKSKKVGIRVTCEDIKGTVPKGKAPTIAVTSKSKCKADLRIKIWKVTF
ncbi:NDR1/HIN1-like protein 13 [Linum perenne]